MRPEYNFYKIQKLTIGIFASFALSFYIISHRLVEYFRSNKFIPEFFSDIKWLFFLFIAFLQIIIFWLMIILISHFEKDLKNRFQDFTKPPINLGLFSFSYSFILAAIEFIAAALITIFDFTLLNVWDILFIFVFIGVFYIGCNFYFYYGIPLSFWENKNVNIELENLKIEYDLQKMYLSKFLWITFSIIVSQVFVILKSRYEPYLQDPIKFSYLISSIVINSIQLCFILLSIWSTIFTKLLSRIEEIKIQLSTLGVKKNILREKRLKTKKR